jgi:hypothetical protein
MLLLSGKSSPNLHDQVSFLPPSVQNPQQDVLPPDVIPERVRHITEEIQKEEEEESVRDENQEPEEEEGDEQEKPKPKSSPTYELIKLSDNQDLIQSPNTVVTAYFTLKSKFAKEEYLKWMSHMLSLQDAMVVFTSPEMTSTIKEFRSHAANRTVIVQMLIDQVEIAQLYSDAKFWEDQLEKDPEKRIHRSYQLFWVWLSKSYFVKTAVELDFFGSDIYMYSDIGCFRNGRYNSKYMIQHREVVPKDRVFQMAHHIPQAPPYIWWNDKYNQKALFYHSGSQMVAYKDIWLRFHEEFMRTVAGFVKRGMFIGEDQTVLQSTCLRVTSLCAYVPMTQVMDNHYFGLRWVVYNGGNYKYWYPPEGLPVERDHVQNKTLLEPLPDPPPPDRKAIRAA